MNISGVQRINIFSFSFWERFVINRMGLLCAWLFFILPGIVNAQFSVVFEQAENEKVTVSFISEPDSSASVTNFFIQEIAKSVPKRYDFTSYHYTFRQVLRVIRLADGSYEASIDINEAHCGGDVIYKDFDISDVLFPNHIVIQAALYDKYKKEVGTFNINSDEMHWGYNKIALKTFTDTIKQPAFTFNVLQRRLYFDEKAKIAFDCKLKLIDKYYQSKATIAQGNQRLETFDFNNIDMIIVYDIMLKDVERQVEELYQLDFPGNLNLSVHDPIGYIDLFTDFSEHYRQVRTREDISLSTLDKIYYEQGLKLIAQENVAKANLYFTRSCNYNPYFVPSWYQRAQILFSHDSVIAAADIIQNVLTTMNPEPAMSDSVVAFAEKILATLQQQGTDYLKLEKYNESLVVMERALKFCTGSSWIKCNDQIYKDYAASKHGLYQSYLTVAEKALQRGRFDLAEVYITEARNYQRANTSEIIGDAAADATTLKMVKAMINKGDTLCGRKKYEQALSWYDKAAGFCDSIEGAPCREELDKGYRRAYNELYSIKVAEAYKVLQSGSPDRAEIIIAEARSYQGLHPKYIVYTVPTDTVFLSIQKVRYQTLIQTGTLSLHYLNYEDALVSFESAKLISEQYKIRKNPSLDSLLKVVAKPVILTQIQHASDLLGKSLLDTTAVLISAIDERTERSGLRQDSLLTPLIKALHERHFRAVCDGYQRRYSELAQEAREAADRLDYISAMSLYASALQLAGEHTDCSIDTSAVSDGYLRATLPAGYQERMKSAGEKIARNDTIAYFTEYSAAEAYFEQYRIGYNGLLHTPMEQLCTGSQNMFFKIAGIRYFFSQNDTEKGFRVLQSLYTETKPSVTITKIQTEAGRVIATNDFRANPTADPSVTVLGRTSSQKWYAAFKKSYLTTWKNLQK